jgi:predicted ArsR family transcriptional regulator
MNLWKILTKNNSIYPTQKEEVLMYLKEHGTISTIEASNKLFIADPKGVIRDLRKDYKLSWKWIYVKSKYGRPSQYKRIKFTEENDKQNGYTPYGD